MMSQKEKNSKEPSVKKEVLEEIGKNEIKRPSELEVTKYSEKDKSGKYKALSKLVDDRLLCKYEEAETKTYYWLSDSDVEKIEEKLRKKVTIPSGGKIPKNKLKPKGWFETKKKNKRKVKEEKEKKVRRLDTKIEAITKNHPKENADIPDSLPGNRGLSDIRDFVEEEEILSLAYESESLMDLLESNYKKFKNAGKMEIDGEPFPGCHLYFEVWDQVLKDEYSELIEDKERVNILIEILEKRVKQIGFEYSENVDFGNGDFWDDESIPSIKDIELIHFIFRKLELKDEEGIDENKLDDIEEIINKIL